MVRAESATPSRRIVRCGLFLLTCSLTLLAAACGEKDADKTFQHVAGEVRPTSPNVRVEHATKSMPLPKSDMKADWNLGGGSGGRLTPSEASPEVPSPLPSTASKGPLSGADSGEFGRPQRVASDPDPKKNTVPPQVWHRDAKRPTVARVYVGDGNALELVSLHVTVTIEGPRARTLVDHIFRNPHDKQLEGTFEYPLPTGASPSYFAMFLGQTRDTLPPRFVGRGKEPPLPAEVLARLQPSEVVKQVATADWGRLQEARVVSKEKALETYEDIVRGKIDPALLEYAGGNNFSGRVFPIPPKGYNRVLLAYEELLPCSRDHATYRFPLPDTKLTELQFTLQADGTECQKSSFLPEADGDQKDGKVLVYRRKWADRGPGGEVRFHFSPKDARVQAISGRQGESGPVYMFARLRPEMPVEEAASFSENAVFVLDTSLSENPDRFTVSMKLLRRILTSDAGIKRFNVLGFNVGAAWLKPDGWFENTASDRDRAFNALDGLVLEGATDLSAAFEKLVKPGFEIASGTPLNVFLLSDGHVTWGETDVGPLVARFETRCPYPTRFFCYRVGLGSENQELFDALTRKGGAIFQCYGEADLEAAAKGHRRQCVQIDRVRFAGGPTVSDVLVAGRKLAVYPDGDVVVAARLNQPGKVQIILEGNWLGKPWVQEAVVDANGLGDLAARSWAEIAVAELLSLNDPALDPLVTAYCQQFGIGSRVASFLVLENEADYKRLNLQEERGRVLPGDLGAFIELAWKRLSQVSTAKETLLNFVERLAKRMAAVPSGSATGGPPRKLLALIEESDFDLGGGEIRGAFLNKQDVPPGYLTERDRDASEVSTYVKEARRRMAAKDPDGSARVLSSIVEQNPGKAGALRLVGYRMLDQQLPAHAARLFQQVQRSRPFEPHSYRDLARALEDCGKLTLAAVQYEIVLAGEWHNRFRDSLKLVVRDEYRRMLQTALVRKDLRPDVKSFFSERLQTLGSAPEPSDLRVTISWNTDATDVDLWILEPDGSKCFYSHNRTRHGGVLTQDQTQGYGPERYTIPRAQSGEYVVIVHYFSPNQNLIGGETHVNVDIARHAGSDKETVERHNVILRKKDEQVEVARVRVP